MMVRLFAKCGKVVATQQERGSMYSKEEVEAIIARYQKGEATLGEVADALDNWDGDPAEVL